MICINYKLINKKNFEKEKVNSEKSRAMTELLASAIKHSFGMQLLHWAVSQSDIWHLAHRCSELAQKINDPLEKSAYVLENLLPMDDDDIDCIGLRDLHLQQMHFDDEDDYNGDEEYQRSQQHNSNNTTSLNNRNQSHSYADDYSGKQYIACN